MEKDGVICSHDVVKIPGQRIQQLPILQLDDKIEIKELVGTHKFDYIIVPKV